MPFKIIKGIAFQSAIEIDDQGKIIKAPKYFEKFINYPLSVLEDFLYKQKIQRVILEDVEDEN